MQPYIDQQRFSEIQDKLKIQANDAVWWKDACLLYFQTFSKNQFRLILKNLFTSLKI
jgi:alpha-glucuronidase